MNQESFDQLLASVREGGAILRREKLASRSFVVDASGVKAIRDRTKLSQGDFATFIGVSVKTLQNWEQDRRKPTSPAATLLRITAQRPALARKERAR